MKKIFIKVALILSLLLVNLSTLEGCESSKNIDNRDALIKTDNLKPAILTFYMVGDKKEDTNEVLDKIAEISNLNIKLDFKWFNYGDYFNQIKAEFAANEIFDAFICGRSEQSTFDTIDMFRNGRIKDITELLPKYAPVIFSQLSEVALQNAAKVNGKYIFIPTLFSTASVLGVFVRQDYADKYNISAINTLHDYDVILKNIKENEKNIFPGLITGVKYYDISLYANFFGYAILDYSQNLVYKWNDPEMKIIPWEQTPEFKETTGLISSWFENGYIENNPVKGNSVVSFIGYTSYLNEGPYKLDFFSDGEQAKYYLYILYKDKKIQRKSPLNDSNIGAVAFNSSSKNTERALMFLNWIQSSQENYDLFNYGLKDRHYILKGERINMPDGMVVSKNPYWWHGLDNEWFNYAFMNINFHRLSVYDTESDNYKKDYIKNVQSYTSYAPHEGFYPDYTSIKTEYSMRIQTYLSEITGAFQTGKYDTNKTASIIRKLKEAGADHIVNEIQQQLDHWRSLNRK